MKVVILAGGLGTRLAEETEVVPKPMVDIGGRPILWHIMQCYAHHGFKDFVRRAASNAKNREVWVSAGLRRGKTLHDSPRLRASWRISDGAEAIFQAITCSIAATYRPGSGISPATGSSPGIPR